MKTEVPKSPSTVSTLKTEVQKSPAAGSSPTTTEEAPKMVSAPAEVVKNETQSSPDTLNSSKSAAGTLLTEKTDSPDLDRPRTRDLPCSEARSPPAAAAIPAASSATNLGETSDSALILALINYVERRENNLQGQRSENLKKLLKRATTETQTAVPRG